MSVDTICRRFPPPSHLPPRGNSRGLFFDQALPKTDALGETKSESQLDSGKLGVDLWKKARPSAGATEYLTVVEGCYERIPVKPFREPPGAKAATKDLPADADRPDEG